MSEFIRQGSITRATRVWTDGMSDWIPAEQSQLKKYFYHPSSPPPLATQANKTTVGYSSASIPVKSGNSSGKIVIGCLVGLVLGLVIILPQIKKDREKMSWFNFMTGKSKGIHGVWSADGFEITYFPDNKFQAYIRDPSISELIAYRGVWNDNNGHIYENVTESNNVAYQYCGIQNGTTFVKQNYQISANQLSYYTPTGQSVTLTRIK